MKFRFIAGLIVLCIALVLQFRLASAGSYLNLSYAALITFSFIFGFWEMAVYVLFAIFIINWQPAPSAELAVIALFPFVCLFLRNILQWQWWLQNIFAIIIGFSLLYLAAAAPFRPALFFEDVLGGILFGTIAFFPLSRWGKP